jgi:hypothetical protein
VGNHTYKDCIVKMVYEGHGESDGRAVFSLGHGHFRCIFFVVDVKSLPPGNCFAANSCIIEAGTVFEHAIRARRGWRRSTVEESAQHVEDEVSVKVKVLGEECRILIFQVYVGMGYKV